MHVVFMLLTIVIARILAIMNRKPGVGGSLGRAFGKPAPKPRPTVCTYLAYLLLFLHFFITLILYLLFNFLLYSSTIIYHSLLAHSYFVTTWVFIFIIIFIIHTGIIFICIHYYYLVPELQHRGQGMTFIGSAEYSLLTLCYLDR